MHCSARGSGPAILFIHGLPTSGCLWDGIIQHLSGTFRCITVDLPGMGKTPVEGQGLRSLAALAEQIEHVREQHGVERWHVVGHDAGCAIAVHYAARFASRVASLALLSPAIFPELKPYFLLRTLRRPLVGELFAPLLSPLFWDVAMRRALSGAHEPSLLKSFREPFAGGTGAWKFMRMTRWGSPTVVLAAIPSLLKSLRMPALIVHASHDILPIAFAQRAASLIPNARMQTVTSGHFSPVEQPAELAAHLQILFRLEQTPSVLPTIATLGKRPLGPARDSSFHPAA